MHDQINNNQTLIVFHNLSILLYYLDIAQRVFSLITHLIYFLLVLKFKKLRYKSYFFINHFMFSNFLYCALYLIYIKNEKPNFSTSGLNHVFCLVLSFMWSVFKFLRYYSILLVSVHRFIAVYHINFFKWVNKSNLFIALSTSLVWFIAIIIAFICRFIFETTYGTNNCFDGYSEIFSNSLNYYMVTVLTGMALPTLCVIVIYILIYKRLRIMSNKLYGKRTNIFKRSGNEQSTNNTLNKDFQNSIMTTYRNIDTFKSETQTTDSFRLTKNSNRAFKTCKRTQSKFANQFLAINFCLIISFLSISLASMRNLVSDLNKGYYAIIQMFRIVNIFTTALIPLFTLFYPKSVLKSILK